MSFSTYWNNYGKCLAMVVGLLIGGVLAGVSVSSSLPALGTFWCGVIGGVGGALSGAAQSC